MCDTCGCSSATTHTIAVGERLLAVNDAFAAHNRAYFTEHDVVAVNVLGTPGAGKTTLLETTIRYTRGYLRLAVVEGDRSTQGDSARIAAAGAPVRQIETGIGCHLDAHQVHRALGHLPLHDVDLVMIENLGTLVCPALFDLGEHRCAVVTSPTEGTDKPLKYPSMFRAADVVVLNKTDLLPHVPFDLGKWRRSVAEINPRARVVLTSALTGRGVEDWIVTLVEFGARVRTTLFDSIGAPG